MLLLLTGVPSVFADSLLEERQDDRAEEFYESCQIIDSVDSAALATQKERSASPLNYSCLTTRAHAPELLINLKLSSQSEVVPIEGSHAMTFTELISRRWAKNKDLLILSASLSVVEAGKQCHRLMTAGFASPKILLGGPRAYLAQNTLPASLTLQEVDPAAIQGPLERDRLRIVDLQQYRDEQRFNAREALSDIWRLQPSADVEQYMSVLAVGTSSEYQEMQQLGLPYWAYLLEGGERAYQNYLASRENHHKMRNTKLRKCALR